MLKFFFSEFGVYSIGSYSELVTLRSLLYHYEELSFAHV